MEVAVLATVVAAAVYVVVIAGVVMGLCGVVFLVAFNFKSIKGPVGILKPL